MPVVAVVPLKALTCAKERLRPALAPAERSALVAAMARHVLGVCRSTRGVDDVLLVAGDDAAAAVGAAAGARVLVVRPPGLQEALARADADVAGADAVLVVPADLPFVRPADLEVVLAAGADGPCVVVAPTLDGGTGALLRRPAAVVGTAFGRGSAARHLCLAQDAGIRAVRLDVPGLARDVDTPAALRALDGWPPDLAALAAPAAG